MDSNSATVLQFWLPFEGLQDRVRAAGEEGKVLIMQTARMAMRRHDISDLLVIRAVRRGQLCGSISRGTQRGEWRCFITFSSKGFRSGGVLDATVSEGRVFVEKILWDDTHDK